MNINIIYESQFGNGKRVVEELAAILESKDQKVDLFPVADIEPNKLPVAAINKMSITEIKAADDFKIRVLGLKGPLKEGYRENLEKFADELVK